MISKLYILFFTRVDRLQKPAQKHSQTEIFSNDSSNT